VRARRDRIDEGGKVTLRHSTRLPHIRVGHAHKGRCLVLLVDGHSRSRGQPLSGATPDQRRRSCCSLACYQVSSSHLSHARLASLGVSSSRLSHSTLHVWGGPPCQVVVALLPPERKTRASPALSAGRWEAAVCAIRSSGWSPPASGGLGRQRGRRVAGPQLHAGVTLHRAAPQASTVSAASLDHDAQPSSAPQGPSTSSSRWRYAARNACGVSGRGGTPSPNVAGAWKFRGVRERHGGRSWCGAPSR
jgi:hypothetical protein